MNGKFTVFFDDPFWVGVFEKHSGNKIQTARTVFGAEPTDREVYLFVLRHYPRDTHYGKPYPIEKEMTEPYYNPKRAQREAAKEMKHTGVSTKAQEAFKKDFEARKAEQKKDVREQKEADKEMKYLKRKEKQREKHSGH